MSQEAAVSSPALCALIVTGDTSSFKYFEAEGFRGRVVLCDRGADAVSVLEHTRMVQYVFADFRNFLDDWAGFRLLRWTRANQAFDQPEFYVMAEKAQPHQVDLAHTYGANGIVFRITAAVMDIIGDALRTPDMLDQGVFSELVDLLARHHESLPHTQIQAVRSNLIAGFMKPSRRDIAVSLARLVESPISRAVFLQDALGSLPVLDTPADSEHDSDPWLVAVHEMFAKYVGLVGSQIVLANSIQESGGIKPSARADYLYSLGQRISDMSRRGDFEAEIIAKNL
jgi:hypothetical protein